MIIPSRTTKRSQHICSRSLILRCFLTILLLWMMMVISTLLSQTRRQPSEQAATKVAPQLLPPKKPVKRETRIKALKPAVLPLIALDAKALNQWMSLNYTAPNDSVLVLVTQPYGVSGLSLEATVRDALSSPNAIIVVHTSSSADAERIRTTFANEIVSKLISVYTQMDATVGNGVTSKLQDDMNLAYLLDLASQYHYNFTLVLRGGMRLVEYDDPQPQGLRDALSKQQLYYTTRAVGHYRFLQVMREQINDANRTCLTLLSKETNPITGPTLGAVLLETKEHAARLSLTLRSTLPYRSKHATEIVDYYCRRLLWEAKAAVGPVLFQNTIQSDASLAQLPTLPNFLNASLFVAPDWIDSSIRVGPVIYDRPPLYTIAFGVTTMTRPVKGNEYLVQFMTELLKIVEDDFSVSDANETHYRAVIVLLVSGNTVTEVDTHRAFLEKSYLSVIARGIVQLVDAPLESYVAQLQQLRLTFPKERPERRYWRSKQNLDIAATLSATVGLSSYIMLLEDDTGFQPGFGASVKSVMQGQEVHIPHGIPTWAAAEYGFGYSGVLIHASDAHVFQQIHATFYDERPCDLFKIDKLVRKGRVYQVLSRKRFANRKFSYLKHNGQVSSLEGKVQDVW